MIGSKPSRTVLLVTAAACLLALTLFLLRSAPPASFKIYVVQPGVYQVSYESLQKAGLGSGRIDSSLLALTHRNEQVPIWVADGGDGDFGPGDSIEFVGEHLLGHRSFYNEFSLLNVYRLSVASSEGLRMSSPQPPEPSATQAELAQLEVRVHWEENNFLSHFPGNDNDDVDPRFWVRMSHIDAEPFTREGFWVGHSREGSRPISVSARLQGWSSAGKAHGLADHQVDLYFNGELVGSGEWNGRESHVLEVSAIPEHLVEHDAANKIEIKIPRRRPSPTADAVVDVVLLDWIEVAYPPPEAHSEVGGTWISSQQQQVLLSQASAQPVSTRMRFATAPRADLVVYGPRGSRFDSQNMELDHYDHSTLHHVYPPPDETTFYAVPAGGRLDPAAVELDRPSTLRSRERQADYLIITHPYLRDATEPLAAFHRQQGLTVDVVSVDDIYDEFNDSILHPRAIRDFLSFAYHEWQQPAPRFVLFVGDSSWNAEGFGSIYQGKEPYFSSESLPHRNLVPTFPYPGPGGHAASDNYFVAVAGDDALPEMAIGRFPVAEPDEVTAIIDKTLRYATEAGVGPWRRDILWLADETTFMKNRSDEIASTVVSKGFSSLKLYPSDEPSTAQTQSPLLGAFDEGQLLVHFIGHGARHVWRTGATDHRNRFDLFGLEHLPKLKTNDKLPLVLSMTCWSAPFDHPTADSIGENFLRLEDRGAIAFLGASWKVSPNKNFSNLLVEGLTSPGTIGEAIRDAKHGFVPENLVQTYNLLGDPAVRLALPSRQLEIEANSADESGRSISISIPVEQFEGEAIIDWLDSDGDVIVSQQLTIDQPRFDASLPDDDASIGDTESVTSLRAYAWSESAQIDGVGTFDLSSSTDSLIPPAAAN